MLISHHKCQWLRHSIAGLMVFGLLTACGSSSTIAPADKTPQRSGQTLTTVALKYLDDRADFSADGTMIVFVSGRDAGDTGTQLKAYKVTVAAGASATVPVPSRLTSSDIGSEIDVVISRDGVWTIITAVKDGRTDLYLQGYASGTPVRITDDDAVESQVSFIPDASAKMFAFMKRTDGFAKPKVYVGDVGDGSLAQVSAVVNVSGASGEDSLPVWAPSDTTPTLLTRTPATAGRASGGEIGKRSFATAAAAASAAKTTLVTAVNFDEDVRPFANLSSLLLGKKLTYNEKQITPIGGGNNASNVGVITAPVAYALTTGVGTAMAAASGVKVQSMTGNRAGTILAWSGLDSYKCADEAQAYGRMIFVTADNGATVTRQQPLKQATGSGWELSGNGTPCTKKLADGTLGTYDFVINQSKINLDGTTGSYRILYTTNVSNDVEVRLLDVTVTGSTTTGKIYNISANASQ